MMNFDSTSREFCTVRRTRTNTPLQALTTLNDAAFFEAAQALARRVMKDGGTTDRDRIDYAFRLCTARRANPAEIEKLTQWIAAERAHFSAATDDARKLAGDADQAAWTMLANVLLNLDETLTNE
jgi:hypothetical protein